MYEHILDPFRERETVGYEHICHRCETVFDGDIARDVVDMVVQHKCHSAYCDDCAAYHPSGLKRQHFYRVTGGDIDFGRKCHNHAVRFYDDAIGDAQTNIMIDVDRDAFCPMVCDDCKVEGNY